MSKMYYGNIDVSKIDKSKIFHGEKVKNLPIVIWVNDTEDKYGNKVAVQQGQTKEERASKVPIVYLGNLKENQPREATGQSNDNTQAPSQDGPDEELPF